MKKSVLIVFAILIWGTGSRIYAQSVGIGSSTFTPDGSSMLEIRATNQGILIPRITNWASNPASPAQGLLIYSLTGDGANGAGFYYYDGGWKKLFGGATGDYIRNQTSLQSPASFNINGNGYVASGVGIGTTTINSGSKLHIYQTGALAEMMLQSNGHDNATAGGRILFNNDVIGNSQGNITFVNDAFASCYLGLGISFFTNAITINGDGPFASRNSNVAIGTTLYVNDVESGSVANKVGIGTSSPGQRLDVVGGSIRTDNQFISTVATGTAPLAVSSTTAVTNLNADLLDGNHSSAFAPASHSHSTLTRGTGLTGNNYNGSAATTWAVDFGNTTVAGNGTKAQGNFGQFQAHSTYTDFNTNPAYWGWNYVQGSTNAPNATSSQWYRQVISLGSDYPARGSGGYSLELAYPRFSGSSAGVWMRTVENGTIGGWTRIDGAANVSGTTNYVSKFTSANVVGNSQIFDNGTNVGIGTTSPSVKLEVRSDGLGTWQGRMGLSNATSDKQVFFGNYGSIAGIFAHNFALNAWADLYINTVTGSTGMVVKGDGNVGIGTTGPAYKLDVAGDIRSTNKIWANANGASYFRGGDDAELWDVNVANTMGVYGVQNSDRATIRLGSSGSDISGLNGNIGIGTTNPAYRLDLASGTFGFGNGNQRTETRDNAGLQGNSGAQSGFFETSSPSNFPSGATSWWHLIDSRHSNPSNNYAMQFAGSFTSVN